LEQLAVLAFVPVPVQWGGLGQLGALVLVTLD